MANYLYNGVSLPDINTVWTGEVKKQRPYAYITVEFGGIERAHYLMLSEKPLKHEYWENPLSGKVQDLVTCEPCTTIHILLINGEWWQDEADWYYSENDNLNLGGDAWLWASHDILKEDGTVFFAASDPSPVLSIDHTAMIQGWIVGKRLAAQRGKA